MMLYPALILTLTVSAAINMMAESLTRETAPHGSQRPRNEKRPAGRARRFGRLTGMSPSAWVAQNKAGA
ncbi:hypothetical protein [Pontivivens ytuae]|uniref:Uncharacterized protein n=1 Tax=Pontivivens ytuae TaxID=2789856 RepID=A0A7S9LR34_9RHOB|nr:hypothetical protein [Pontivivens ytuae]QPH53732.1 hypothetical protein I0K15_18445 [Pontivivens ytuae]